MEVSSAADSGEYGGFQKNLKKRGPSDIIDDRSIKDKLNPYFIRHN